MADRSAPAVRFWRRVSSAASCAALLVLAPPAVARGAQGAAEPASLRQITVTREADTTVVTLESDRPLPAPQIGMLDGPPRIFFDFTDVIPKGIGMVREQDAILRRIRVATHSGTPLVTRVVFDLRAAASYRLVPAKPGASQLQIVLTAIKGAMLGPGPPQREPPPRPAPPPRREPQPPPTPRKEAQAQPQPAARPQQEAQSPSPPQPVLPLPIAPPEPGPPAGAAKRAPAAEAQTETPPSPPGRREPASPALVRYRQQVAGVTERFQALRELLLTIDRGNGDLRTDALEAAQTELQDIERTLTALKPADSARVAHDLLLRACGLARTAVRLRLQPGAAGREAGTGNASSAAAGAILLLDRAVVNLNTIGSSR